MGCETLELHFLHDVWAEGSYSVVASACLTGMFGLPLGKDARCSFSGAGVKNSRIKMLALQASVLLNG
jgi:hypothetical protein